VLGLSIGLVEPDVGSWQSCILYIPTVIDRKYTKSFFLHHHVPTLATERVYCLFQAILEQLSIYIEDISLAVSSTEARNIYFRSQISPSSGPHFYRFS